MTWKPGETSPPSDAAGEFVDVLDDIGRVVGCVTRSQAEAADHFFANVLVFVFDPAGFLLVQRRPADANAHRGLWDVSACGAVRTGETAVDAAHRELVEETGFDCDLRFVTRFDNRFHDENGRGRRRLSSVFIGVTEERPRTGGFPEFDRIKFEHIVERVSAEPAAFVPSFLQEFAYAAAAFNSLDAGLEQSMARHPSNSWRHLARERISDSGPHTVDLRIVGLCQLRCAWCWGPDHMRTGSISPEQWQRILAKLHTRGTRQIVLSGGEPTLSPALRPCVETAKALGLRVTLSSNGLRLAAFEDVLTAIDDLGIPLDGSTPAVNDLMRARSLRHQGWEKAVDAVLLAQRLTRAGKSSARVTVRTVIARPNLTDVADIPAALRQLGVDLSAVRIKMYQVEPFGPHVPQIDFEREWAVTAEEATSAYEKTAAACPEGSVTLQLYSKTGGRYFLVDPDGNATGTDFDPLGTPIEVPYGNLLEDFEGTLTAYLDHQARLLLAA